MQSLLVILEHRIVIVIKLVVNITNTHQRFGIKAVKTQRLLEIWYRLAHNAVALSNIGKTVGSVALCSTLLRPFRLRVKVACVRAVALYAVYADVHIVCKKRR